MARPVAVLDLHPEEQRELERRVRAAPTSRRDCLRARIVLLRAEGVKQRDVAERLGVSVACVNKWSQRFDREGLAGLQDMPGRGRRPTIPLETVEKVVTEAGRTPPGRQRWSTRTLAAAVGIAPSSVGRIWHQQGLKPHRTKTFKLSSDKQFESKFWDVIGACTWTRPRSPWCCAATRRANARRWSAPSPPCRLVSDTFAPALTTTFGTAPCACLRR